MTAEPKRRVLLVDDEEEFLRTLSERLEIRDYSTAVACDGEEGLALAAEHAFDVVILDHKMPGLPGIEVLGCLKRDHPFVEVILLTGHGADGGADRAMRLGAFAFLEKPVDFPVLLDHLDRAYSKACRDRAAAAGGEA